MSTIVRLFERIDDFSRALSRLKEALDAPESDLIRDACIQRFEFCFELAWKTMKTYLEFKSIDVRNARDTFREALKEGLIQDASAWTEMLESRNLTSHTYDQELAERVVLILRKNSIDLFQAFEQEIISRRDQEGHHDKNK